MRADEDERLRMRLQHLLVEARQMIAENSLRISAGIRVEPVRVGDEAEEAFEVQDDGR